MAEGMLGGILGDEDENPQVDAPEALAGAEAFASAVAARLAGGDPEVARRTADFLVDQSHLLKVQTKPLEDDPALSPSPLGPQAHPLLGHPLAPVLRIGFPISAAP